MKKIVAFIGVLALAVSLFSMFSFDAAPEEDVEVAQAGDNARSPNYCYAKQTTRIYTTATGTAYRKTVYAGDMLEILSGHTTERLHVRTPDMQYYGYVLRTHVIEPGCASIPHNDANGVLF